MNVAVQNDELFAEAAAELDGDDRDKGLWARCFSECEGDESKAKALYMKTWVARKVEGGKRHGDEAREHRKGDLEGVPQTASETVPTNDSEDESAPIESMGRTKILFFCVAPILALVIKAIGGRGDFFFLLGGALAIIFGAFVLAEIFRLIDGDNRNRLSSPPYKWGFFVGYIIMAASATFMDGQKRSDVNTAPPAATVPFNLDH